MTDDILQFRKRIIELSNLSYNNSQYFFTDFMNEAELSELLNLAANAADRVMRGETVISQNFPSGLTVCGGHEEASRYIAEFGSEEAFAYKEDFPIAIIHIEPVSAKFAEALTHRDFLGAILNLGIDRKVTGDILTDGTEAYLIAEKKISSYILENLVRVKHVSVKSSLADEIPERFKNRMEREEFQLSSERIDALVAQFTKLSRSKTLELFRSQKIFINGRQEENPSTQLKVDDRISVRGFGKLIYLGTTRITKKGKYNIAIERYI